MSLDGSPPKKSIARRLMWLSVSVLLAALCAVPILLQLALDEEIERRLSPWVQQVDLTFGNGRVSGQLTPSEGSIRGVLGEAELTSRLVRRNCAGAFTVGYGARIEIENLALTIQVSSQRTVRLTTEQVCFDVKSDRIIDDPHLEIVQGGVMKLSGTCGPKISDLHVDWTRGELAIAGTAVDRSSCLKKLTLLAPEYPSHLVPKRAEFRLKVSRMSWDRPELAGRTPVAVIAEISRRLEQAAFEFELSFFTDSGEEVTTCLRRVLEPTHSEFEVELGLSEVALQALTEPFLSGDTRRVLMDLRSDDAACDGSARGLLFSSDLHEVALGGRKISRVSSEKPKTPGFREAPCDRGAQGDCSYRIGFLQLGEDGRLAHPSQLEAIARELHDTQGLAPFVIFFVHGWRHSAHPRDQSLLQFEGLLEGIAKRASTAEASRSMAVTGVYVSWPGRLFDSHAANQIATFFNRLEVARAMGGPEGDIDALLERLTHEARRETQGRTPGYISVLAHSMGADPLMSVLFRHQHPNRLGDLVVAINPAVSVSRFRRLKAERRKPAPPLLVYGSKGDQTTQQMYPMGAALSFDGKTREALYEHTTTVTNHPQLVTHQLRLQAGHPKLEPQRVLPVSIVSVEEKILPSHAEFLTTPFVDHLTQTLLHLTAAE